jgi:DNA repair photolyase
VLGEFLDQTLNEQGSEQQGRGADRPQVPTQVFEDATQTIINRVKPTSDVPFDWTLNPYRGCEHGCVYCFARPYHEYLGFSCGLDFETKIVAKPDAPRMLLQELARPSWRGEPIVMSAITDIYQPIEKHLRIARGCLEVLADCAQPVTTMTKSALVLRDTDLWARMTAQHTGRVVVTLVTLDHELAAQLEPRAASPSRRLHVIRELVKAGVDVSVNVAPVIPGLTDREMPAILQAVADAGGRRAAWVMLRLPYQLKDVFLDWLQRCVPDRAARVESLLRQSFDGRLYRADTRIRRRGQGEIAAQIARMFEVFTRRYGLNRDVRPLSRRAFKRPNRHGQMGLFG